MSPRDSSVTATSDSVQAQANHDVIFSARMMHSINFVSRYCVRFGGCDISYVKTRERRSFLAQNYGVNQLILIASPTSRLHLQHYMTLLLVLLFDDRRRLQVDRKIA